MAENGGGESRRLNSWKEIAAFFGKDERTVKRWETGRGLPVRRVPGGVRTSVFAYVDELESWLSAPRSALADLDPAPAPAAPPMPQSPSRPRGLVAAAAIAVLGTLAGVGAIILTLPPRSAQASVSVIPAEAQLLYREGVIGWTSRTAAGFETAIGKFDAALAIAPDYAAAHAGLANVYNLISQYTLAPEDESYARARAEAERALALDPNSAEAYAALGFNRFYADGNLTGSAEMFEKALALDPDNAQTLHWYALTSMQLGKFDRPLELIQRALALQPETRSIRANAALITYYAGRHDEAIAMLEQLRQANPDYLAVPSYLATLYLDQRRYSEFLDNYETAARVEANDARQRIAAAARAALPDGGAAMLAAMLEAQLQQYAEGQEPAYKVAATAALLGENERALDYLQIAVDRRETLGLLVEPEFRTLRDEPRFKTLVAELGLPAD